MKALWTLNIGNYEPEITKLTYPFMELYANKIGAEFHVITDRKFPDWPVTYEKLQIHELGRDYEWNIYVDSDTFINPEMFDPTNHISKTTVCHNGNDMAGNRWRYDEYFLRDNRHIGSCNWFTCASHWCLDLWRPMEEPFEVLVENIFPTVNELSTVITREHLIDDYALSRNIARFGLKFTTVYSIQSQLGLAGVSYFWHEYTTPIHDTMNENGETIPGKLTKLKEIITRLKFKLPQVEMELVKEAS